MRRNEDPNHPQIVNDPKKSEMAVVAELKQVRRRTLLVLLRNKFLQVLNRKNLRKNLK